MRLSSRRQQNTGVPAQFDRTSSVAQVRKDSPSLKTTIPEEIAKLLNLKKGDLLRWQGDIEGGEVFVTVEKAKEEKQE